MAGSTGTLTEAIAGADEQVTVLDDKVDAEDHAAYLWMRAHVLQGHPHVRVVVGTERLSHGWMPRTQKFADEHFAEVYLQVFSRNHASMHSLRLIADAVALPSGRPRTDAEVITAVAGALMNGRAWLIELPRRGLKSRFITKTDPSAMAPLNPKYGTKVDFSFIASLEGNQWLRGYIPIKKKTGLVAGQSGMTVATGFDLGQWSVKQWENLGFPKSLINKIQYFAAPNNFKGKNKAQVATAVGKLGPVPVLSKSEADLCDGTIFGQILSDAGNEWNALKQADVPAFTALPSGWQTVWLSRSYQEGGNLKKMSADAVAFRRTATAGKWLEAIAILRAYREYGGRTRQEADLLTREVPPPMKPAPGAK